MSPASAHPLLPQLLLGRRHCIGWLKLCSLTLPRVTPAQIGQAGVLVFCATAFPARPQHRFAGRVFLVTVQLIAALRIALQFPILAAHKASNLSVCISMVLG